jgi:hypothetical protein
MDDVVGKTRQSTAMRREEHFDIANAERLSGALDAFE